MDFEIFPTIFQAAIYKADFESERQSREEINDEKLQLEEKCRALEARLGEREMQEMQRRHGGTLPPQPRRNAEEVGLYGAAAAIPPQRQQGQPATPLLPTTQPPVYPPNPIEVEWFGCCFQKYQIFTTFSWFSKHDLLVRKKYFISTAASF